MITTYGPHEAAGLLDQPSPIEIDLDEISARVDGIDREQWDDSTAAVLERELYTDLVRAIACGTADGDVVKLCQAALESQNIAFYRW